MRILRTFKTALHALRRNVMRAVLTTLGIVIGVGAVIAMVEIGTGSSQVINQTIASMGANNILIQSGAAASGGVSFGTGSANTLTPDDAEAIERDCPSVKFAAPLVRSRVQIVYGNKNWVPNYIYGTTPTYLDIREWPVDEGETITERDVRNASKVCLVGQTLVRELFGGQSPIGKEVRVNNVSFKVVGILSAKGASTFGSDQDDVLMAPWTTIKYRVSRSSMQSVNQSAPVAKDTSQQMNTLSELYPGQSPLYPAKSAAQEANSPMPIRFSTIDQIMTCAWSTEQIQPALDEMTALLRERHRIRPGESDDFNLRDMTEMASGLTTTAKTMGRLLFCVALISLIVGGVGIM